MNQGLPEGEGTGARDWLLLPLIVILVQLLDWTGNTCRCAWARHQRNENACEQVSTESRPRRLHRALWGAFSGCRGGFEGFNLTVTAGK
jgi:hypothetical protein